MLARARRAATSVFAIPPILSAYPLLFHFTTRLLSVPCAASFVMRHSPSSNSSPLCDIRATRCAVLGVFFISTRARASLTLPPSRCTVRPLGSFLGSHQYADRQLRRIYVFPQSPLGLRSSRVPH